jgi:hypothetical protein
MTEERLPSFGRKGEHLNLIRKRFFKAAKNVEGLMIAAGHAMASCKLHRSAT